MKKPLILRLTTGFALSSILITSAFAEEPSAKAGKYHEILRKRPSSGYVFDRFYDTWLDTGTSAELEKYLSKAAESGKANDHLLLAYYYLRQGKELEALKLYQTSIKGDPTNSKLRLQKAKLEAQLLNFDGALKDLDAATAKANEEEKDEIQHLRGRYLARSGRFDEARKTWGALLKSRPKDDELIDSILEVQLAEGLFDEALVTSALQIKNAHDPYQKVVFTLRRGDIYQRAGKRKKAIDTYVSTLDAVGESSWIEREILAQLREIFRRDDDMEGLKKLYADLSKTNPQRVGLRKAHAHLLASLGEFDKAEALLREILKITPGNRKNREELVSILLKAGKADLALKEVQELAKSNPKDSTLQLKLVSVQHASNKDADISVALNSYLSIKEHRENAYLVVAGLYKKYKKPELAVKELRKALEAHPDSEECSDALAGLLVDLQQKDEAITIWKKMIAHGNRESVIRHSRSLKASGEEKLAYKLITGRLQDFKIDVVFLTFITNEAVTQKDFDTASESAQTVLKYSKHTEEIRQAVKLCATVALKGKKEVELTKSLANNAKRSTVRSWLLAELYEMQGQSKEAVAVLESLRKEDANMAAIAEVSLYEHRSDWKNAAEAMERMLALPKGKKPQHLRRLVGLYTRLDDSENALKHIETWKQLAAGDKSPWFMHADILSANGDRDEAIQILRRAAQRFEEDNKFHSRLAGLYQDNGQFGDAERLYWRLYEEAKNLNDRMLWVPQLSEIYEAQGKSKELIARFNEKRKSNPKSVEPLLAMAEIHRFNENYEERRKSMLEAARLRPNDPDILYAIAQIEEREGDVDRAADTLIKASSLDQTDQSKRYLAQFYMRNGEVDKGVDIITELAGGPKVNPRDMEKATASIANSGDTEAALKFLDAALITHPDDYRLAYLRAVLLVAESQFEPAFDQLVAALDMNKDLQGVRPIMTQAQWLQQFQMTGGFLPKSQISMLYDNHATRLISNKSRGNAYSRRSGPGRQPITYQLPGDLKEKQPLIEGSLLWIINQMDDEEKPRHIAQLNVLGLEDVEYRILLARVTSGSSGGRQDYQPLKEYARKHPTRAEVFTFPVMVEVMQMVYGNSMGNKKMDDQFLKFAQKNAKNLAPFLSFSIEMALLNTEDKKAASESWKRALVYARKMKKESIPMASTILAVSLSKNKDLNSEVRSEALKLVREWYWGSFEMKQTNQNLFMASSASVLADVILRELAAKEDHEAFVVFLQKTCDTYLKVKKSQGSTGNPNMLAMMRLYGNRSGDGKFPLPPFPPKGYDNVPMFIGQMFTKEKSSRNYYRGRQNEEPIDMASLSLDKVLDKVSSPYLRIRIADYYDNNEELASAVKAITSAENPTLHDLYYHVGYLTAQENFMEAATVLAKARYLPMRRNQRKELDEYLTSIALHLISDDGKETDKNRARAIDEGKRAALRLRKSSATPQERQRLIAALDDFGLQKEADLVASTNQPVPAGRFSGGGSNAPSQIEQIKVVLEKKEKDKAQRLILREIKRQISQAIDYNSGRDQVKLLDLLVKHQLCDWAKQRTDPGDSTSIRRRSDYALTLILIGKKDEGLKILDELGKEGSKDEKVLMALALNLPEDRLDEAGAYLAKVISTQQNFQQSSYYIFNGLEEKGVEAWLHGYKVLTESLRHLPDSKKSKVIDLSWVTRAANGLVSNKYVKGTSFPSIGDPEYPEKISKDQSGMLKKRMLIARKFLETAIKKPSLAAWAFPYYESSYMSMEDEADLEVKLALLAIKNSAIYEADVNKNMLQGRNNQNMMMNALISNSSSSKYQGRSPMLYLAKKAFETNNHEMFSADLIKELGKIDQKNVESIMLIQNSLFKSEKELESTITKLVATESKKGESFKQIESLASICVLRRQLSPAFEQWMSQKISLSDSEAWLSQQSVIKTTLPDYVQLLMEKNDALILPLLERIIVSTIQPEGDIGPFIQKLNSNSYTHDIKSPVFRLNCTKIRLGQLCQFRDLAMSIHTARCLAKCGFKKSDWPYTIENSLSSFRPKTLKDALDVFDHAGFSQLQTADELVCLDLEGNRINIFGKLVERLGSRMTTSKSSSSNIPIIKIEKELPSLTKNQQLFVQLAIIARSSVGADHKDLLLEILKDHTKTIEKWDDKMAAWFSEKIIKHAIYDKKSNAMAIPNSYPKSAKITLQKFMKSMQNSLDEDLDKVIAMKEFKDSSAYRPVMKTLSANTSSYIKYNREKYIEACVKVASMIRVQHAKDNEKQGYNNPFRNSYFNDPADSFYGDIISNYSTEEMGNKIGLLSDLYLAESNLEDASKAVSLSTRSIDRAAREFSSKYNYLTSSSSSDSYKKKQKENIAKLLSDCEKLPESIHPVAALTLIHFIFDDMRVSRSHLRTCMEDSKKEHSDKPSMIRLAFYTGVGAKNASENTIEWGEEAAKNTNQLYDALKQTGYQYSLIKLLATNGNEMFCDTRLQIRAAKLINELLPEMDMNQRYEAYKALHGVVYQSPGSEGNALFLELFDGLKRELSRVRDNNSSSSSRSYSSNRIFQIPQQALLGLALRSGDEEALRYVTIRQSSRLAGNPFAVILALRYGKTDLAHKLWRSLKTSSSNSRFSFSEPGSQLGYLDQTIMKSLEEFVKKAPKDGERQFLRDSYLVRTTTFNKEGRVEVPLFDRYKMIAGKSFAEATYDGADACALVDRMLTNPQFPTSTRLDGELEKLIQPFVGKFMKDIRLKTSDDLSGNWKKYYFRVVALYFKQLVVEEKLDELTKVIKELNAASIANKHNVTAEPMYAAAAYLKTKIFDAVMAGDKASIAKYKKFIKPMAYNAALHSNYYSSRNWALSVPLLAICESFSDTPQEYQKIREVYYKKRKNRYMDSLFPFVPLTYVTYKGKKFLDPENTDLRIKIFKQAIAASHAGMAPYEMISGNGSASLIDMARGRVLTLTEKDLLTLFDYAHTVNPAHGDILSNIGSVQLDLKMYTEAEKTFQRAIESAEQNPKDQYQLGTRMYQKADAMARQKRYTEAVKLVNSIPAKKMNARTKKNVKRMLPKWKKLAK